MAEAVALFAIGLLARSLIEPVTRAFYAMHDTRTPVVVPVVTVFINIALSWVLMSWMGHGGLALSLSLTYTFRMLVLVGILSDRTGGGVRQMIRSLARMLPPTGAMAIVSLLLMDPLARITDPVDGRAVTDYVLFAAGLLVAGVVYLAAAWLMRLPELDSLLRVVERRLGGKPVLPRRS